MAYDSVFPYHLVCDAAGPRFDAADGALFGAEYCSRGRFLAGICRIDHCDCRRLCAWRYATNAFRTLGGLLFWTGWVEFLFLYYAHRYGVHPELVNGVVSTTSTFVDGVSTTVMHINGQLVNSMSEPWVKDAMATRPEYLILSASFWLLDDDDGDVHFQYAQWLPFHYLDSESVLPKQTQGYRTASYDTPYEHRDVYGGQYDALGFVSALDVLL